VNRLLYISIVELAEATRLTEPWNTLRASESAFSLGIYSKYQNHLRSRTQSIENKSRNPSSPTLCFQKLEQSRCLYEQKVRKIPCRENLYCLPWFLYTTDGTSFDGEETRETSSACHTTTSTSKKDCNFDCNFDSEICSH
jgi:hypothetical protein